MNFPILIEGDVDRGFNNSLALHDFLLKIEKEIYFSYCPIFDSEFSGSYLYHICRIPLKFSRMKSIDNDRSMWVLMRSIDRCVVSRVVDVLMAVSDVKLGCGINALSCVDDCWWDEIFWRLECWPDVACRLTIEIGSGGKIALHEKIVFLDRLRAAGVRIAYTVDPYESLDSMDFIRENISILKFGRELTSTLVAGGAGDVRMNEILRVSRVLGKIIVFSGVRENQNCSLFKDLDIKWIELCS